MWVSTATCDSLPDVESRGGCELAYMAIQNIRDFYPGLLFSKFGKSGDREGAKLVKMTCDSIKMELDRLLSEEE